MIKYIGQHIFDFIARFRNDVYIESDVDSKPTVTISSGGTAQLGGTLEFVRTATGADNMNLGDIYFKGKNDADEDITYAHINGDVQDASDGAEEGKMVLNVASHDGESKPGLTIFSGDVEDEVDVNIGNGTGSTTTIAGDLTVRKATIQKRAFAHPETDAGDHTGGDVWYFGSTTGMTAGKIYYLNTSGTWTISNCDAAVDSTGLLAVALGDESDNDGMLLRGFVTLYEIQGTEDHGLPIYLNANDGGTSIVAPTTSGHFVRIVGYAIHNTNDSVYFNPDNTWVEIA